MVRPLRHAVRFHDVLVANALQHLFYIVLRIIDQLNTHNRFQHFLGIGFRRRIHNSRAIDQKDALHERNVLPDLRFACDRCHLAHLLATQRIDNGRFADVRVSDETDANLLLVHVQLANLAQKIDERTLTERMRERSVKCNRWVLLAQYRHPTLRHPDRHKIHLVEDEEQVFVWFLLPQKRLDILRTSAHRIACIQHLQQHVGRVYHLVQLVPNSLALASGEDVLSYRISHSSIIALQIVILRLVVPVSRFLCRFR
uniref:Uncharacterized protein n=1 Tax=Anopheles albimanus TaxID=7167 RepID=A0A182FLJ1_ANOAL